MKWKLEFACKIICQTFTKLQLALPPRLLTRLTTTIRPNSGSNFSSSHRRQVHRHHRTKIRSGFLSHYHYCHSKWKLLCTVVIFISLLHIENVDACLGWFRRRYTEPESTETDTSSSSSPKSPIGPIVPIVVVQPTQRPNMTTIPTYTCPPNYDLHYCLNGATCFSVKIGDSTLYNCECGPGYVGQRCEFKDLDQSYLASRQRQLFQQAGITSIVVVLVIIFVAISIFLYVRFLRKKKHDEENLILDKCGRGGGGGSTNVNVNPYQIQSNSDRNINRNFEDEEDVIDAPAAAVVGRDISDMSHSINIEDPDQINSVPPAQMPLVTESSQLQQQKQNRLLLRPFSITPLIP